MEKIKTGKHSLSDWTFEAGSKYFTDDEQYVSPPTSLCTPLADVFLDPHYVFLNESLSGAINAGMFITDAREASIGHRLIVRFRHTNDLSAAEGGHPGNGYAAIWDRLNTRVDIYRAGLLHGTLLDLPNSPINTWHSFKVLWYSYLNPSLDRIVRIWPYVMVNAAWHDCGYVEDTNPLHEDDPVNRVGFAIGGTESKLRSWVDDTQIWSKIT